MANMDKSKGKTHQKMQCIGLFKFWELIRTSKKSVQGLQKARWKIV